MSEIAGKAEIPDQPEYVADRPCSLMISCKERQWKNLTENEQSQLGSSNSHSCFHPTATVPSGKRGSEAKAETGDMSWVPSVTKLLWSSPAWFLCLQTSFQLKLELTVQVFSIPYSMSWQLFPSQQPGQVFLLFFMLKMTTLLSQHARSPRLSGNTWHSSRRHFFFQELNKSWVLIIQGSSPSKCFPHLHFFSSFFQYHTILTIMLNITKSPLWHTHLTWGRTLSILLTFTKT